jgi:hypothetical protein
MIGVLKANLIEEDDLLGRLLTHIRNKNSGERIGEWFG